MTLGIPTARASSRARLISPWIAALGYALYGGAVGGLSLLVFPLAFLIGQGLYIAPHLKNSGPADGSS